MKKKSIMLIITHKCNLNCVYCYEPKKTKNHMSLDTAKQIIMSQLSNLDSSISRLEIQFMGGEPLLEFDLIRELSEWIWSQEIDVKELILFASTNGTLLNDTMKSWFYQNRARIVLGLSFDGNSYMQNLNRSNSYSIIDLEYFRNTWPTQGVKMTISPYTISSLYEGVVSLHKLGFYNVAADLAMGRNVEWSRDSLLTYREQLNKLVDFYIENMDIPPFSMLGLDVRAVLDRNEIYKTCSCGEELTCYDWDGETYACHLFSPVTIERDIAISTRSNVDFSNHSLFTSTKCEHCLLAGVCNRCYGMNYICSGDVSIPSSFHCSAYKINYVANCRLQLAKAFKKNKQDEINQIIRIINNIKL